MNQRLFKITSLLLLTVLILSACNGTNTTTAKTPLRVGWSLWPGWYPLVIAREQGLFKKHGVDVELVFYDIYKETMPALGSGMLDGAALALGDSLLDSVAEDTKVIVITDNSAGADQIVAAPEIKSVQDLKGKRIGVQAGTYGEILVQQMLDKNGIARSDVTFVEVPVEGIPNAIPNVVEAGHTFEPFASQARAKGFNPIFTSADTPGLLLDVFAFRSSTLAKRPEDVKAFVAAWFEAVQYWKEHPAEGNAIIAKAINQKESDISIAGIKIYSLDDNLKAFQESNAPTSIYYPAQIEMKFLSDRGIVSYPIPIDANFLSPLFLQ